MALINVDENGVVSQSGGVLVGQVDGSGNIVWQTPNPFHVSTGTIDSMTGILASAGSIDNGGAITHFRIEANNAAGGFGAGGGFANSLQWCNPSPTASPLNGITHGDGIFVAVGAAGSIIWSGNGTNWQTSASGTDKELNDVAYGNGAFVAVGDNGTILSSTDAINWSARSSSVFQNLNAIAFGNGTFVAGIQQNGFITSSDGTSWSAVSGGIGSLEVVNKLEFNNGRFVAISDPVLSATGWNLRSSTDGASWTAAVGIPETSYNGLAFGAGRWVITGNNRTVTFTSSDGSGFADNSQGFLLNAIVHDGSKFIAGTSATEIKQSTDGATWTTLASASDDINMRDAANANGVTVIVGEFGLLASSNSTDWTNLRKDARVAGIKNLVHANNGDFYALAGGSRYYRGLTGIGAIGQLQTGTDMFDVVEDNFLHIVVGRNGVVIRVNLTSPGGQTYPSTPTSLDLFGVGRSSSSRLAAVGDGGTIITSTDQGQTWTSQSSPVTSALRDAEGNGSGTMVAVGDNGVILTASDTDFSAWTLRSSGTTRRLNRVNYNTVAGQFVAVGDNGTILTSADGMAWTSRNSGITGDLTGVGRGPHNFAAYFAVSDQGEIITSTDNGASWMDAGISLNEPGAGVAADPFSNYMQIAGRDRQYYSSADQGGTWTLNTYSKLSGPLEAVAFGNGRFVGVGDSQSMVIDDNGDVRIVLQSRSFLDVAYGNGTFVAVGYLLGSQGGISTSTDGVSWITETVPHLSAFHGVHFANGLFVAAGDFGRIVTSTDGKTWTSRVPDSTPLKTVTHGNGVWLAMGDNGVFRRSADGVTWIDDDLGSPDIFDVRYADGLFVAVGEGGAIRTSTDGDTWASRSSGVFKDLRGVAHLGGTWVAVGLQSSSSGPAVVSASPDGITWTAETSNIAFDLKGIHGANGTAIIVGEDNLVMKTTYPDTDSPVVTSQPMSQTFAAGSTVTLTVSLAGASPFDLRWFKDGRPLMNDARISGANTTTLTITGALPEDAGEYWVSVNNSGGGRASLKAILTGPPMITQQPQSAVQFLTSGATFSVEVSGTGPFTYVWKKNGSSFSAGNVSGQGTASLDSAASPPPTPASTRSRFPTPPARPPAPRPDCPSTNRPESASTPAGPLPRSPSRRARDFPARRSIRWDLSTSPGTSPSTSRAAEPSNTSPA